MCGVEGKKNFLKFGGAVEADFFFFGKAADESGSRAKPCLSQQGMRTADPS